MLALKSELPVPGTLNKGKSIGRMTELELRAEISHLRHLLANAHVANREPVLKWEAAFALLSSHSQDADYSHERAETLLGAHPGWFTVVRKALCDLLSLRVDLCDVELATRLRHRDRN